MSKKTFFRALWQSSPKTLDSRPTGVEANRPDKGSTTEHRIHLHEARISAWMGRNGILLTRIALGVVFVWFGALKLVPGMSEAEGVARRTLVRLTLGLVPSEVCLYILAAWECVIGLGLLWGRFLRSTLALLFLQLAGTFLPLLFFPSETWKHFPYAPTLEGQYIIKNLVLISAGIIVGSTMRGGKIISDPLAARVATRVEKGEAATQYDVNTDRQVRL